MNDPKSRYISGRHEAAKAALVWSLEHVRSNIDRALRDIESGEHGLDEHLVTNAAPITREIAVYNLTRELRMFDEVEP